MKITKKLTALITLLALVVSLTSCTLLNEITGNGSNNEATHTHNFTNWKVTKNASCTENGVILGECSCGEKTTDTLTAVGHNYASGICTVCGASEIKPNASTGFTFIFEEAPQLGTIAVISGIGECTDTELILPETTPDGTVVCAIAENAFANCDKITKVTIPVCYGYLARSAFDNCTSLEEIVFEGGYTYVNYILPYVLFKGCTSLKQITVKEDATTENDTMLWDFLLGDYSDSMKLKSIDGDLYYYQQTEEVESMILLKVVNNKTKYVFPDNCTADDYRVFWNCTQLKEIVIHKDLKIFRASDLKDLNVTDIYYEGSEEEWNSIPKGPDSPDPDLEKFFEEVNMHFNYVD